MKKTTFLIAGKHAVYEALKNSYRKVQKVFLTEDSKKTLNTLLFGFFSASMTACFPAIKKLVFFIFLYKLA